MRSKEWKKIQHVGRHAIGADEIQDPSPFWRARTVDTDHVLSLKESFQTHQKMDSKGLRLVLQCTELWQKFNDEFFQKMNGMMNWQPFTGASQ